MDCEARPLRRRLGLRPLGHGDPFKVYVGGGRALVVSGVGTGAAAAAVGHLARLVETAADFCWLNVGTAGHATLPVGTPLLARAVVDAPTGARWQLPLPLGWDGVTAVIRTVQLPEARYAGDYAFDMEAAGFVAAAGAVMPTAPVQCLKVISDNSRHPVSRFNARAATALIERQLGRLELVASLMQQRRLAPTKGAAERC